MNNSDRSVKAPAGNGPDVPVGTTPGGVGAPPPSPLSLRVRTKHVLIALGALGVMVGGLVFALEGSQPDFVCRLNGQCRQYGRCVGFRFTCSGGSTAECRASDACHKDGLCSAGGGACVAASDQDCASSEACRKEDHCAQLDGQCTAEWQRAQIHALAAQQAAAGTVEDYLKLVAYDYKQFEASAPHLEAAEWGTAKYNGRVLPAAIVRASITITDRLAGERRPTCTVVTAINDKEFGMWRAKQGFRCNGPKLAEELAEWRVDSGFTSKGSWAQTPAVALGASTTTAP